MYRNFVIFKMAAPAILDVQNSKFLRSVVIKGPVCVTVTHFIKISQTVAEIWRFNIFPKWRPSANFDLLGACLQGCICQISLGGVEVLAIEVDDRANA